MSLTEDIKHRVLELGFDLVGITDASSVGRMYTERFEEWLTASYAGQMVYMYRAFDKRTNPGKLMEGAQSLICVGLSYRPPKLPESRQGTCAVTGRIADYAQYDDYHHFMRQRLREVADYLVAASGSDTRFKICVDSAPVAERALAARAGLGFIGKNHMLINPELGPQVFLGEIVTNLRLDTDRPIVGDCGDCNRCMEACPTGALRADGRFDASKCISYLTIEHHDKMPPELTRKVGEQLFGCDECVHVCPYQQRAPTRKNTDLKFHRDRTRVNLHEIMDMTPELFETRFGGSVIQRSGLDCLKRNARLCLANMASQEA